MTTLTTEYRALLRDLASQATSGPWWTTRDLRFASVFAGEGSADDLAVGDYFEVADAAFIAAAREAVPALLDALDEAEAERDAAREVMDRHQCDEQAERAYLRAKTAEAAVQRVRDLTYASTDGTEWEHNGHVPDLGEAECPGCWVKEIHRALDGDA